MRRSVMTGIQFALGALCLGLLGRSQDGEEWGQRFGEGEEHFNVELSQPRFEDEGSFRRHEGHWMGQRLFAMLENDHVKAALGLSDQQTDRLRQIMVEAQKSSVKARADVAVRGIELRELLRADKPDRDSVMKKVQEISDLRRDIMRQHIDALLAAKTVLTPEQQRKIRTFMMSRRGTQFRRERFRPHPPRGPGMPGAPPEPPRSHDEPPVQ